MPLVAVTLSRPVVFPRGYAKPIRRTSIPLGTGHNCPMPADFSQDHVRLSDADRQQAISHLEDCTKDGRLDLDEFTQRVEQITGAKTYGELRPIFADLPNLPVAYNARPAPDRSPMPASDD